jgi:hypothetical protein
MGQVGVVFHLCCLVYLTSGFFLDAVLLRLINPHSLCISVCLACPMQDEHSYPFKGITFKLVARKSLFYV